MSEVHHIDQLLRLGRWQEAISRIEPLLATDADDDSLHARHATALNGLGSMREARRAIKRAIALDPTVSTHHLQLGEILSRIRLDVEAHKSFEEALRLWPHSLAAKYAYVHAILCDPRIDQAIIQIRLKRRARELAAEMLKDQPNDPHPHAANVRVQLMDGNLEAADRSSTEALRLAPNWAHAHQLRGEVLEAQGRAGEAGDAYVRSGKLDPTVSTSRHRLAGMVKGDGPLNEHTAIGLVVIVLGSRWVSDRASLSVALFFFVAVTAVVAVIVVRYQRKKRATRDALSSHAKAIAHDGRRRFRLR